MMGFGWMGGGMWLFWVALATGAYFLFYGMPRYRGGGRDRAIRIAEELDEIRDNLGYG